MNVRCDNCKAVFTLGDVLYGGGEFKPLPATIQVECGRCDAVFEAAVPGRGPKSSNPALKAARKDDPDAASARAQNGEQLARALKPRRPGEPSASAEHVMPPLPAAEEEGEFDRARRRSATRNRYAAMAGIAGVVILALAIGVPILKRKAAGLPKEARAKVEAARGKLLLDDAESLDQAIKLFKEAARIAPGEAQLEADVAYAMTLLSESHRDLADRMAASGRTKAELLVRLRTEQPDGWEQRAAQLNDVLAQLAGEQKPHIAEAERLLGQARSAARAAAEEDAGHPSVVRALALYYAVTDAEKGRDYLERAVGSGPKKDALALYTRAAAQLSGAKSRDKQEKALALLAELQQVEPAMLRAQYDAAAIAADRNQYGPARDALAKVLAANPQHERARALLASLPGAPQVD